MYEEVITQLEDHCDCFLKKVKSEVLEKSVIELINLVSTITCWTQQPCETFLNSERTESLEVKPFDPCKCDEGIIDFEPFYHPVDPDSFIVKLYRTSGIDEEEILVEPEYYNFISRSGLLKIDLRELIKFDCCPCQDVYSLEIVYNAGYENIPECLLPIFCDMLHILTSKNDCSCERCQACEESQGYMDLDGEEDITISVTKVWEGYLLNAYRLQLGLISLCNQRNLTVWGFTV